MRNAAVFEDAARAFLALLASIQPEQWELPGLGVWTVRSLAGHTARAILTVGEYLSAPAAESAGCPDAEAYFAGLGGSSADDAGVAARGVAAGQALGEDAASTIARTLDHVLAAIAAQPSTRIVAVVGGRTIPLAEYLRTRTLELVVHTLDLSRATGIPHALPPRGIEEVAGLAARVAARGGQGEALLLALTGRSPLPEGFSVV